MSLPSTLNRWQSRTKLRAILGGAITLLIVGIPVAAGLWLYGFEPHIALPIGAVAGLIPAFLVVHRFRTDPLYWLERRDRATSEKLETAEDVYEESGPVIDRLKHEADDLASSISFSQFAPPLPVKRVVVLLIISGTILAYTQAPPDLRDRIDSGLPDIGGDTPTATPTGPGGGPGGGDDDVEPGEGEDGAPGGDGGEVEPGEPSDIRIGDDRVPVTVYPSYGSDREADAGETGDFVESGDFPPRAESSGTFAESLPERHRDAIIRYFSSMVR